MFDDQDRHEWVNVPSGTGSTGQSRTKGRKSVVYECVCVMHVNNGDGKHFMTLDYLVFL